MIEKHAKAPWEFILKGDYAEFKSGDNKDICAIPCATTKEGQEKLEANARLITAAPELLEALERCYKVFKMDEVDTALSLQCGMATSKARGQA